MAKIKQLGNIKTSINDGGFVTPLFSNNENKDYKVDIRLFNNGSSDTYFSIYCISDAAPFDKIDISYDFKYGIPGSATIQNEKIAANSNHLIKEMLVPAGYSLFYNISSDAVYINAFGVELD